MKVIINKYQLLISLSLDVNPMKEGHFKHIRNSEIIILSIAVNDKGESAFQRVNQNDIKT